MLDALGARLPTGTKMLSRSVPAGMGEGKIAQPLGRIQTDYPEVAIGSYPTLDPAIGFTTTIVLRSRNEARLIAAEEAVKAMIEAIKSGRAV
jgi:molybdopterin-biosynthesis enzyme MoeA-like protein